MGGIVWCNGGGIAGNSCTLTSAPAPVAHQHHSHVGADHNLSQTQRSQSVSAPTVPSLSISKSPLLSILPPQSPLPPEQRLLHILTLVHTNTGSSDNGKQINTLGQDCDIKMMTPGCRHDCKGEIRARSRIVRIVAWFLCLPYPSSAMFLCFNCGKTLKVFLYYKTLFPCPAIPMFLCL